jgi:hypothetical protein
LKSIFPILIFLFLSRQTYSQDSLYASEIESTVCSIEAKIIGLGQHMFIRNVQIEDWYEEYIVDTVNKNLLRVKFYRIMIDTLPIHHAFVEPFFTINTSIQSYSFYYKENQLIKVCDNIEHASYYTKDKDFITNDKNSWRWRAMSESGSENLYFKTFWFYSNRFIKHFRHLF